MRVSNLYNNSGTVPFASFLSLLARKQAYRYFLDVMRPTVEMRILDIGVTNDDTHPESNFFEQWYPHKERLVCVGTEDGSHLEERYPGIRFLKVNAGAPLPFAGDEFDIVFSNAVLEHVGSYPQQRSFVREACRVGKRVFLTTPNRWFPVEHHTGLPLLHYLPKSMHRPILRHMIRYKYWADEQNLNALTRRELLRCFPPDRKVTVVCSGLGLGPFRSGLIAHI